MAKNLTHVTLREHLEALREADQRALQIKEKADEQALGLARDIQTYKDEKANELRSQIESERGTYATHIELASAVRELKAGLSDDRTDKRLDTGQLLTITLLVVIVIGTVLTAFHI